MEELLKLLLESVSNDKFIIVIEEDTIIIRNNDNYKKEEAPIEEDETPSEIIEFPEDVQVYSTYGIGNGTGVNPPPTGEELDY